MINRTNMVLISGAITNSLDRFKIRKLEGRPLLLAMDEEVRPLKEPEIVLAIKEVKRIFKYRESLRGACLNQIELSLKSTKSNLGRDYKINL